MRANNESLQHALASFNEVADRIGAGSPHRDDWVLERGSKVNGAAWRVAAYATDGTERTLCPLFPHGHVGMTAGEARETLERTTHVLRAMARILEGRKAGR